MGGEFADFLGQQRLPFQAEARRVHLAVRGLVLVPLPEYHGPVVVAGLNHLLAATDGPFPNLVEAGLGLRIGRAPVALRPPTIGLAEEQGPRRPDPDSWPPKAISRLKKQFAFYG